MDIVTWVLHLLLIISGGLLFICGVIYVICAIILKINGEDIPPMGD